MSKRTPRPTTGEPPATWLNDRAETVGLTAKASAVVEVLATQPRVSSYASTQEIAALAGVNVATVTRASQTLGFAGWPALQSELRARYLASLSVPEVAAEHDDGQIGAFRASLRRDLDAVAVAARHLDGVIAGKIVRAIATSRRTLIVAEGSYAAAGITLAHNAVLAGYPVELTGGHGNADTLNALADLGPKDTLVAISLWRLYAKTVRAAQFAHRGGATVCAITDSASTPLAQAADHCLLVSAEGASFFPAVTATTAVCAALCAELATLDRERTDASLKRAEATWDQFNVLHVPTARRNGTARDRD